MKTFRLKSGLTIISEERPSKSVSMEVTAKVGSVDEDKKTAGISHFIEHMLFEGTKNRTAREIANEIESIGGEINAATSAERTSYYITVLKKHFGKALAVLADMVENPLFDRKTLEKERKVVLDEVNFVTDDPKMHQWVLFQQSLFKSHPCRNPIYGTRESIRAVTREGMADFYRRYYKPSNMIITVVGNVKNAVPKIEKAFSLKGTHSEKPKKPAEPKLAKSIEVLEKRQILQSYFILGWKAVPRKHKDSYVFDVIKSILGRGQSSALFNEIRTKRGLAYSLGAYYEGGTDYGWFAVYVGADRKNLKLIRRIIMKEIRLLAKVPDSELRDAKNFIEGNYTLTNEDNHSFADMLAVCAMMDDAMLAKEYTKRVMKVTKKDVARVARQCLKDNFCAVTIMQGK